ncbi:MAG: hypothetical protein LUE61_07080 [Clostridiales bacterium]|nr:hypothetical protein [Clostridiales bacterium]
MINFLTGMVTGGAIVLIILCAFAVNHDKPKPTCTATGTDFWRELVPELYEACGLTAYLILSNEGVCMGTLNGDTLTVQAKSECGYRTIVDLKVFEALESAASVKAGRPITVVLLHNGGENDD